MTERIQRIFYTHGFSLALLIAFLIPIKLSLTNIVLIPTLLLFFFSQWKSKERWNGACFSPLLLFLLLCLVSSLFGIDPLHSAKKIVSLTFAALLIPFYASWKTQRERLLILLALLLGQSIAAFHSLLESAFPEVFSRLLIGAVSESGQLSMTVIVATTLTLLTAKEKKEETKKFSSVWQQSAVALLTFLFLFAFAFRNWLHFSPASSLALFFLGVALTFSFSYHIRSWKLLSAKIGVFTFFTLLPLLSAALLANLKRGPWLGVFCGLFILFALYLRKLLIPVAAAVTILLLVANPLRTRILESPEHFFIAGGRADLWTIGIELASDFPVGIGYNNSSFLRKVAPEIPPEHEHFHSNFFNIVVETGYLGVAVFLWWLLCILKAAFHRYPEATENYLAAGLGCSIVSWQIAGLVEYNFGDSEVVFLAFLLLGVLQGIPQTPSATSEKPSHKDR